nr:MAG TPA: hypothetical protein [Caudoviricetes sp.]
MILVIQPEPCFLPPLRIGELNFKPLGIIPAYAGNTQMHS